MGEDKEEEEIRKIQSQLSDLDALQEKIDGHKEKLEPLLVEYRTKRQEAQVLFEQMKSKMGEMAKIAGQINAVPDWKMVVKDFNLKLEIEWAMQRQFAMLSYEWGWRSGGRQRT